MLVAPVGSAGDVHPFIGIGIALKARGHDVSVVTNPYFGPVVTQAGLRLLPWGTTDQFDTLTKDPDLWHREKGARVISAALRDSMPEMYRIVTDETKRGPLLVVGHGLAFAARFAQETLGTPLVTLHLQPASIHSVYDAPVLHPWLRSVNRLPVSAKRLLFRIIDLEADRIFGPAANALYVQQGLARVRHITSRWWHSTRRVIGLFPPWYAPPQPDWPEHTTVTGFPLFDADTGDPLSPDLEQFLDTGPPPVVFLPGSANRQAQRFFSAAAHACQILRCRGILLTRYPEHLPKTLPEDVRHVDYVPLGRLLPRAAALVHHGGIGTAAQGLAAGLPQVVMPMAFDQPDNASRLGRLGVARTVWPHAFRGRSVATALDTLLSCDTVSARCAALAEKMRTGDPVRRTCELIEEVGDTQDMRPSDRPRAGPVAGMPLPAPPARPGITPTARPSATHDPRRLGHANLHRHDRLAPVQP